ncbi:MAG: outer membrane beta-barrel protein, partial [Alphaproteobacteria bacterium]|nr:outer membrane beta-barrel protein [Alphaproteobacteria bacterium]
VDARPQVPAPPPDPDEDRGKTPFDRQRDDERGDSFTPRGARVGTFILFPSVNLSSEWNSNVFAESTNEVSDTILRVKPVMLLRSDWEQHFLAVEASAEAVRFMEYTSDDQNNASLSVRGNYDASEALKFNARVASDFGHEERGDPDAVNGVEPTPTRQYTGKVGMEYRPARVGVTVNNEVVQRDYDDVSALGGAPINNDDRDRLSNKTTVRLGYEYLPDTDAFVELGYNVVRYDQPIDDAGYRRDSNGQRVGIGTEIDFTGVTVGEVFVGWARQDYEDDRLETFSGIDFGSSLRWNATKLTTARLSVTRSIDEVTNAGASGRTSTSGRVDIEHELLRNLVTAAYGSYMLGEYSGITQEDETWSAGLKATYQMNRYLQLEPLFDHRKRTSNVPSAAFTQSVARLNVTTRF